MCSISRKPLLCNIPFSVQNWSRKGIIKKDTRTEFSSAFSSSQNHVFKLPFFKFSPGSPNAHTTEETEKFLNCIFTLFLSLSIGVLTVSSPLMATAQVSSKPSGGDSIMASRRALFDPVSEKERELSQIFESRVAKAVEDLEKGREAQANGEFEKALSLFSQVVDQNGDLALASYARVGRAVTLYEVGDRSQAILEMEDMSIALKGYPEIHAALAAAFYSDKHALAPAEKQFTLATLLDKRYTDVNWVAENKHWPPSLLQSLQKFLSLQ